tara:strand:- start:21361 stop:22611 length:1251 start_codon:yes stop_codon:yes gene_type:complete
MSTGVTKSKKIEFPYANAALLKLGVTEGGFLPSTAEESWKYTNLARLAKIPFENGNTTNYHSNLDPSSSDKFNNFSHQLFFINGKFMSHDNFFPPLPMGIKVDLLDKKSNNNEYKNNSLLFMNQNLCNDRVKITIGAKIKINEPISLIFYNYTKDKPLAIYPNIEIVLEEDSNITIIEQHLSETVSTYWENSFIDIDLHKNAELKHYKLNNGCPDTLSTSYSNVLQDLNSKYICFNLAYGSTLYRNETHVSLNGENSECNLYEAHLLNHKQHADTTSIISHNVPNCISKKLYRGVLNDNSRAVAQAKVKVSELAQLTDAQQLFRGILLSPNAEINTKPELEIFADDVKCSHGAAVGSLDEEQIFYLRSRGLNESASKILLIEAFMNEHFALIENPMIRELMLGVFDNWITIHRKHN